MKVEIKNTITGEIREGYEKYDSVFNWAENNYSCDCNRGMFFESFGNEETTEHECSGATNIYLVNLYDDNGKQIYSEFIMDDKMKTFEFGEWVLIDGKLSGQYVHKSKGTKHTIDFNGDWIDFDIKRIAKDKRYTYWGEK